MAVVPIARHAAAANQGEPMDVPSRESGPDPALTLAHITGWRGLSWWLTSSVSSFCFSSDFWNRRPRPWAEPSPRAVVRWVNAVSLLQCVSAAFFRLCRFAPDRVYEEFVDGAKKASTCGAHHPYLSPCWSPSHVSGRRIDLLTDGSTGSGVCPLPFR